ncbi:TonB-like protein [Modicisalibacter xianhensis]|uniref:TonB-like protein n=1 Tax=Modicisalibacter xianhensis TaxID=442341 RepID=A0A4R8FKR9_9GAMM|nr:TonB C-terminal domain-containing protein [Halomonas xianhensis]TDX26819.1 TonB-like protein [Halomonas xianhensis]
MTNFLIGLGVVITLFYAANELLASDDDTAPTPEATTISAIPPGAMPRLPGAPLHASSNWHERHLCLTPDCQHYRRETQYCHDAEDCTVTVSVCHEQQCVDEALIRRDPAYEDTLSAIQRRVSQQWIIDPDFAMANGALVEVSLLADGTVLGVIFKERSGRDSFDFTVMDAIDRAAPFPEVAAAPTAVRGLLQRFLMTFGTLPLPPQRISHQPNDPVWHGQQ